MGKIIVSFSHKRGVGKTTLVQNIGVSLMTKGKNVLLIDFDSQRNLSANIAGFGDSVEYKTILNNMEKEEKETDEEIDKSLEEFEKRGNKWQEFENTYASFLDVLTKKGKQIYKYTEYSKRDKQKDLFHLIGKSCESSKLSLIRGDMMAINDLEKMVQSDKFTSFSDVTISNSHKIQETLINLAKQYDFILIDTAPSSVSLLNGLLVQICDYFYTPFQPNLFSLQALQGMDDVINHWNDSLKFLISGSKNTLRDKAVYLGCIVNMTKKYNNEEDKVPQYNKEQKEKLNSALKKFVKNRFINVLTKDFSYYFLNQIPYIINDVRHFTGKLGDIAEKNGISVYELTNDITKEYNVDIESEDNKNTYAPNFKDFKKTITEIADGFIKLP